MKQLQFFLLTLLITACAGGGGDPGSSDSISTPGEEDFTPTPVDDGTGKPAGSTATTCDVAEDCGYWFCECADGAVVNTAHCQNGYCLDPASTCPEACSYFQHGNWTGRYGGGPTDIDPGPDPVGECDSQGSSNPNCQSCAEENCCDELAACDANPSCLDYWDCVVACLPGDSFCRDDCASFYPGGVYDYEEQAACLSSACYGECS